MHALIKSRIFVWDFATFSFSRLFNFATWMSILLASPVVDSQAIEQFDSLHHKNFISFTPRPLQSLAGDTVTNVLIREGSDVWISTSDKIFRFDGNSLSLVPVASRTASLFPESQFEAIIENSFGDIFLVAFDGFIYQYSVESDNFVQKTLKSDTPSKIHEIKSSHLDGKDNIWLGFSDGTIGQFNTRLQSFNLHQAKGRDAIIAILELKNSILFVDQFGGALEIFEPTEPDHRYSKCGHASSPFSAGSIDEDGLILLGTQGDGVWRLDYSKHNCVIGKAFQDSPYPIESVTVHEFSYAHHGDRRLTLISTDYGVFVTHKNKVLTALHRSNSGIGTNEVLSANFINDFSILLGTYTGIRILKRTNVELISQFPGNSSPSIVATARSTELGTFTADYTKVYKLKSVVAVQQLEEVQLARHQGSGVMSMAADDKSLWIGFRNGHLLMVDPITGTQREISTDSLGIRIPPISSIYIKNSNQVFIGTFGQGVYVFENKQLRSLKKKQQKKSINVLRIKRLNDMGVIAFSEASIEIIDLDGENERTSRENLSTLSNYPIWSIDENSNSVWFATPTRGLYVARRLTNGTLKQPKQIVPDTLLEGLVIYGVRLSDSGLAYFSSNRGIFKANSEGSIQKVFHSSAANSVTFDYGTEGLDEDNNILFGGTGGFVRIDPRGDDRKNIGSTPNFTKIHINGERHSVLNIIRDRPHVEIEYPVKVITFEYSVFDLSSPEDYRYRYKLHPFDPTWIDGGNDGSATYTNIPPGDYVFHVQGANSAGVWNREGISMNLRVLPPLWQTWWAYCLYALAGYFLLYMGKKWYDSNVLRVKATEMAREKTRAADTALDDMQEQLEAQDSFVRNVRQRNIATLATVRDLIDHRADYLPDDVSADIMRASGGHVHALALLEQSLKYYNDMLFADLNAFTADCISDLCREYASTHAVTTINEVTDQLVPTDDATPLAIIIYELLHNAFEHAFDAGPGSKYLRIIMAIRNDARNKSLQLELKVQDNGSGIPVGAVGELPGLSLVQNIVRRHNGTMETICHDGSSITIELSLSAFERV